MTRPGGRLGEAEEQARDRALARAARADERDRLARPELEVEPVEHEPASRRDRRTRRPRSARARRRGLGGASPADRQHRRRRLEQREHPLGDREPVGARVELRAELAQRQVQLGREHEHRQARPRGRAPPSTSRTPTVTATSATPSVAASSSTEPERKRDPERAHRRAAVALADLVDAGRLRPAAVERAQRRQAAHDVEEVRREEPQREPALARALLGVAADQPHEHRHERQRQQHAARPRCRSIARRPSRARRAGRPRRARPAAGSGRSTPRARRRPGRPPPRSPPASTPSSAAGCVAQPPLDEREPQLGEHGRGGARARRPRSPRRAARARRTPARAATSSRRDRRRATRRRRPARRSARAASPGRARARAATHPERGVERRAAAAPAGRAGRGAGRARASLSPRAAVAARERLGRRLDLLAADAGAEDVVRPALVEQDERHDDQGDDASSPRACSARTRRSATVRLLREVGLETITRG